VTIIVGAVLNDGGKVGAGLGVNVAVGFGVTVGDGVKSTHEVRSRLENPLSQRMQDSV